jgi:DNA-binding SARP family transcriptional activator
VYRVLGGIAVAGAPVTRRRERELLGLLVAAGGAPVAVGHILDELGCDRPAAQVAVSRLRALLDPTRSRRAVIESTPAGYRLIAERDLVDAWSFEHQVDLALAAPTPADRLVLATRAAELCAGAPYAECQAPALVTEAARLEDLRVSAQETRAEALLALGHPAAAVRLLVALAPQHPYREPLWALLARAQYSCARQADALATLAALRSRLAEDLGVDPSPVVRRLEQAILTQDPGLADGPRPSPRSHRPRTRVVGRCRAVSAGYVVGHTPAVRAVAAGTMTG